VLSFRALRRFDLMLFPGTGVFDDFLDTPLGWASRLLRWCTAARLSGMRVAFLSVGAGPILNPISRFLMKEAAAMAHYRSYRDPESKAYMLALGVRDEASDVLPDVAFLLPKPDAPARAGDAKITIGVGVMNYSGWRRSEAVYADYIAKHAEFIDWIEAQGYGLRILVGQTTDWRAVEDIEQKLGRSLAEAYPEPMASSHDVMRAAAATDVVIAARYHVQIAALKMGRPVISLTYAPKNDALLAAVGLQGFSHDIHAIDTDRLAEQVRAMVNGRERYGAIVRERVAGMEGRLAEALAALERAGV
jgi:polysaccharide pyruvyl transferase WcaK-like protein